MNEIIFLIEEDPAGGYTGRALDHAIFTEGESLDEIKVNIKEAVHCHFEGRENHPDIIRLHFVKEETLSYA